MSSQGWASLDEHQYEALSYFWAKISATITESPLERRFKSQPTLKPVWKEYEMQTRHGCFRWMQSASTNLITPKEVAKLRSSRDLHQCQTSYCLAWWGIAETLTCVYKAKRTQIRVNWQGDCWFLIRFGWYRDKTVKESSDGSMLSNVEYQYLSNLLRRGWFHRTWVIQEVTSARDAIVVCGCERTKWETFADI
jgi:hypothetical protein